MYTCAAVSLSSTACSVCVGSWPHLFIHPHMWFPHSFSQQLCVSVLHLLCVWQEALITWRPLHTYMYVNVYLVYMWWSVCVLSVWVYYLCCSFPEFGSELLPSGVACTYRHKCMCINIHLTHLHVYVHTHMNIYLCYCSFSDFGIGSELCPYTCIHIHIHVCVCVYTYYAYIRVYTCIYNLCIQISR